MYWDDYLPPMPESYVLTPEGIYSMDNNLDYSDTLMFTKRDYNTALRKLEKGLDWDKCALAACGDEAEIIDMVRHYCLPNKEYFKYIPFFDPWQRPTYYDSEYELREFFIDEVMSGGKFKSWRRLSYKKLQFFCSWADKLEYEKSLS